MHACLSACIAMQTALWLPKLMPICAMRMTEYMQRERDSGHIDPDSIFQVSSEGLWLEQAAAGSLPIPCLQQGLLWVLTHPSRPAQF